MAAIECAACKRKFEAQLLQLNNKLYCVDCFNVVKTKEQSQ